MDEKGVQQQTIPREKIVLAYNGETPPPLDT